MPLFDVRDLVAFPGGNNASDTVIGDVHFNLTALEHWNYTLYSNGTLSNGSRCYLTFAPYTPTLVYANGSFINATSCYSPIKSIGVRAEAGIAFAVAFGVALVLSLVCLSKHGRLFLPAEKRFWPIGRRWQWYWALIACAAAVISLFMTIDVDRYYLSELPIVLTAFFWYLLQMATLAVVWEAVRHWGSWSERQYIDPNPFVLALNDNRALFEFFVPLVFYLFLWLNFFLVVPRSWSGIEKQRSPDQTAAIAAPHATDSRLKAAAFMLLVAWVVTVVSLRHSIQHYMPRNRGVFNRLVGLFRGVPLRFALLLPLSLAMIAYQALCAWKFEWSVLNVTGDRLAIYLGGYAPSLLILLVQLLYGWLAPNEDRELIRQRRVRGAETDRELGIVQKPAWWRRVNGDFIPEGGSMRDRIARNVREIGGGTATTRNIDRALETRAREAAEAEALEMNALGRTGGGGGGSHGTSIRSTASSATAPPPFDPYNGNNSTGTLVSLSGPPQQVRSMLDI
ncbi:hypothetical protein SPI_05964 [Niveomyces insectorum RCEF 264]|uniref:Uncharacterized protein n=1 Tax=Niveomyces insectorum RCEF 264 TaxID=1081102 RepID=A0A167SMW4_9HYPO|nr:hypothetical protein SPI_05964 [Niveomyces insectorum RCEF 264]